VHLRPLRRNPGIGKITCRGDLLLVSEYQVHAEYTHRRLEEAINNHFMAHFGRTLSCNRSKRYLTEDDRVYVIVRFDCSPGKYYELWFNAKTGKVDKAVDHR